MRIAHIADLHCCREHAEEALASLRSLAWHIKKSPVDLVVIAGDTWDASMLCTEGSGFNRFVDAIRDIADIAPVAMIYGTPSHDTDGSLEVFRKITCNHNITILEPGQAYFLKGGFLDDEPCINGDALVFGIPEPRKKYLLANEAAGKNETDEAVRGALHRLCFGLGAKRRKFPDIPCIVLYHGEVAGSRYQSGQVIERGTGIAITIDDLKDIGADYYALGHIHEPQEVKGLPAFYAGSIYPKNFGETHQAGFNMVTLYNGEYMVERVDFPQPRNLKIELKFDDEGYTDDVEGKRVWLEVTCTRTQREEVDIELELEALLGNGALPGSRVTINELPEETVRAAEITGKASPVDKFALWAENTGNLDITGEYRKALEGKIGLLQDEVVREAGMAEGAWELVSVRLRGAVGIKKGTGKEEIAVNFDNYDTGLIALCGANGKGKTTLIDNCHPYPQLFNRRGKLQDHFYLKDSYRETVYRNRANGSELKFLIQIDGQNKSGSCKYFIFRQTAGLAGTEWGPLPGIDGNLRPYEDFVNKTFGPAELFLRTAFAIQKPTKTAPDLTEATAGEKKALFTQLAGIDYLQRFAESALERQKAEQAAAHDAEIKAQMLKAQIAGKPTLEGEIAAGEARRKALGRELETILEKGKAAMAHADAAKEKADAFQDAERKAGEIRSEIDGLESNLNDLAKSRDAFIKAASHREEYESLIARHEQARKTREAELAKKQAVIERNAQKQAEFSLKLQEFHKKVEAIRKAHADKEKEIHLLESQFTSLNAKLTFIMRDAEEISDTCPACGQLLPEDKRLFLEGRRTAAISLIDDIKGDLAYHQNELETKKTALTALQHEEIDLLGSEPEKPAPEPFDDTALKTAGTTLAAIDIDGARNGLQQAQEAAVRIEELEKQIRANARKTAEKKEEARIQQEALDKLTGAPEEYAAMSAALAKLQEEYAFKREEAAALQAQIEACGKRLREIEEAEMQLADVSIDLGMSQGKAADWELLARAFGRDGIQALELDALAPGIAGTANRILASAYGDRFRIEIRTTRMGGTGKKTKQIEDFLIYVIDSEDGEEVILENKSGGEAVWIKRAIYDAFSVIRNQNTGFCFLTCFQDEADGALDSAAKTAYCRMLEAAHTESNLRHTVIITHSEEVKAMIPQKIEMEEM